MTLRGRRHDEVLDPALAVRVEELRRRVAWQVSTAYGLAVPDVQVEQPPAPAPAPRPLPAPAPEPDLPPAARADRPPLPTLPELERLVSLGAELHPGRAEEWRWYLFYLRDFASADGRLPADFGLLVETAFGPLLPSAASAEPVQIGV